jgi:peptide/nickel transport system permease protein
VWTFFLRRLVSLPPLLLVISFLTYMLLQASGGDFFNRLEEDPKVSQDYVMALRASAGRVVPVQPAKRAAELGEIRLKDRTYAFDAEGSLLRDGVAVDPKGEQDTLKRFTLPSGDEYTITEQGNVYLWVGRVRGYFAWLGNAVTGDLGESFQYKTSVAEVIRSRLLNTLLLSSIALLIAWGLAIPLGVWSGVRPNSLIDYVCGATAYFGLSIPSVFLALLAVLFAYYTGWFPIGGMRDLVNWGDMSGGEKAIDLAHHLVLPASVVGLRSLAGYMRQMRGQMVETMSADYVRTARSKGLARRTVIYKHALRNAINPLLTLLGFSLAGLLSGSFLVEVVMNWPGLARVVVDAVFARDEPLVMAAVLVATLMLIAGNIIADLLLAAADPRIRLE